MHTIPLRTSETPYIMSTDMLGNIAGFLKICFVKIKRIEKRLLLKFENMLIFTLSSKSMPNILSNIKYGCHWKKYQKRY